MLCTTDGSSPRVRGTPLGKLHDFLGVRFIPACAGNAIPPSAVQVTVPVHPRVCGERIFRVPDRKVFIGSSPRVRGTLYVVISYYFKSRFIPACAGNA